MQTVPCVRCSAQTPPLRQVSASSRGLQSAVRPATSHSAFTGQQKRKYLSTVTCCQNEDKSADKQTEASKHKDSGKSKRFQTPNESNTRRSFNSGQPDDNQDVVPQLLSYWSTLTNLRALKQELSAEQDWQEFGEPLITSVALPGCVAVSLGFILHMDPYANFHWSPLDLRTGLTCAIPLVLYNLALMLPKFSIQGMREESRSNSTSPKDSLAPSPSPAHQQPQQQPQQNPKEQTPSSLLSFLTLRAVDQHKLQNATDTPAFSGEPHPEPGVLPRYSYDESGRQWDVVREALRSWQVVHALVNPGFTLLLPLEAVTILLQSLAMQMLTSGILLIGLSGALTDRILQTQGLNLVPSLLNPTLSPAADGKWGAILLLVIYQILSNLGTFYLSAVTNSRDILNAKDSLAYDPATRQAALDNPAEMIANYLEKEGLREKYQVILMGSGAILETVCVGSSFVLTGNLLAPVSAKASCELFLTLMCRAKYWQLQETTFLRKI